MFWNLHEVEPGKWDFSGDTESGGIYKDCRGGRDDGHPSSGPYMFVLSGIWWVSVVATEYTRYEIRRDNTEFLKYTKKYIDRLYGKWATCNVQKVVPIIMVQCENEFGSYVSQRKDIPLEEHRSYNAKIKGAAG